MINPLFRIRHFFAISILIFGAACANVVAPTGGPKDEAPPVVLRSVPANYSTFYKGQDVRVFFDEFVEVKNLSQNLLVSPPLEKNPEVRVKGRSIIMSLSDTLLPNTTYNFFFGESIVDITEGNAIPNFQFIFSTGSYVDSLSVRGQVVNALTLEPEEGVFVMLYDNVYDSVPMLQRPVYLSKTNKEGQFSISNMKQGNYLMFSLRDANSNYLYDSSDEKISFLDSLIQPEYAIPLTAATPSDVLDEEGEPDTNNDLNGAESINGFTEDLSDSLPETEILSQQVKVQEYKLFLFQETDTVQRVLSSSSPRKGRVNIAFRVPVDSIAIREYREPVDDFIKEFNGRRDTLSLWFAQTERDSLFLELRINDREPDSLKLSLAQRASRGGRGAARAETDPALTITASSVTANRRQPYFKNLELLSTVPVSSFNSDSVSLFVSDSIPVEDLVFRFADSAQRRLQIESLLEPDSSYTLMVLPGAFTDLFGAINDTLQVRFKTTTPSDYGSILVNLTLPEENDQSSFLLQLLNEKWEMVAQKQVSESRVYTFEHLAAANFRLRLVLDENQNGQWDTGNYLKGVQPEKVIIYPDLTQTRLNWEVEVIWILPLE